MVPPIGDLASSVAGIDPRAGRTAVAVLIAAIAVPVAQRLRPRIDRIFFGERLALEHGTADLLRSLAGTDDCDALLKVAGEELHRLLQPRACAVYARTARNEFESAFVAGRATPVAVPGVSPLVATLGQLHRPLALEAPPRRSHTSALDPFARAALEALGAAVVVPVVVGDALAAFVCLGPKRSGDIYTATDLAHLASIAQTMVDQLRRFASEAAAAEQGGVFRREGDIWTIAYAGKEVRLRDMRGFHYLAALLREPGRELHASQLVGGKHGAPPAPIEQEGLHVGYGAGVAGERMDAKARAAYKARIAELHDAIAEAERLNDRGRLERASHEREALLVELGAAARGQRTGSDAERARLTATKGIKAALDKIAVSHPELGAHLQATVRRGYFCSYQPDPRHPIEWET
jgi:hypothetical protein